MLERVWVGNFLFFVRKTIVIWNLVNVFSERKVKGLNEKVRFVW